MTTILLGPQGAQPTAEEIQAWRDDLACISWPTRYARTLGRLEGCLELITIDHRECREASCGLCIHLRRAHAAMAALSQLDQEEGRRT